jgi:hypothetical protein
MDAPRLYPCRSTPETEMQTLNSGLHISDDEERSDAIATIFCSMNSEDKAKFFNRVSVISRDWKHMSIFQWRQMEEHLTESGKLTIRDLYEHTT